MSIIEFMRLRKRILFQSKNKSKDNYIADTKQNQTMIYFEIKNMKEKSVFIQKEKQRLDELNQNLSH
ncbi:MAG: hypothetical protein OXE77_02225 [Flavobacteriaceae bacterium]|nr:hypothetical protein [Flavobacteriaceae bacterium]MCY4267622.1 hypothetical protein [Flavobacteriaceae bacterium]